MAYNLERLKQIAVPETKEEVEEAMYSMKHSEEICLRLMRELFWRKDIKRKSTELIP